MTVRVAAVQPPLEPDDDLAHDKTIKRGLALVVDAIEHGAQIVCLPEYFAVIGLDRRDPAQQMRLADAVLERCRELCPAGVTILCPTVEFAGEHRYNTTWVLDGNGRADLYRKTHLTKSERVRRRLVPGDTLSVFEASGLRFGIASCYDMYFPETARVLALAGARAIFFPALQRAESLETIQLQVRVRALDNCVFVVRSAFGHPAQAAVRQGITLGGTCVADWEGRLVADLGVREGVLYFDVPTAAPPARLRSYEGEPDDPARYLFEDRRPELYRTISEVMQHH
ncbi:carbon-nitrogen hydrolase family protein [Dactylosporangium sp. CA-233914]|uniref:carbon-nitrogen hydrolase family protein n=1 Tax=Dactylosporangium sp. CA-233914 TaxID=3239934 RepID=UPI003D8ED3FB